MPTVGLIDYGAGNFASVRNALEYLDVKVVPTRTDAELRNATHLILPGVGAFAAAMRRLEELGLVARLRQEVLDKGKPMLGICVGMQILADIGREFETYQGLGLIPGSVERMEVEAFGLRSPHIGWNELRVLRNSPLVNGMADEPSFYFAHSYRFQAEDPAAVYCTCSYGEDLATIVGRNNTFGVQFHPEKSQRDGLRLLKNFVAISN